MGSILFYCWAYFLRDVSLQVCYLVAPLPGRAMKRRGISRQAACPLAGQAPSPGPSPAAFRPLHCFAGSCLNKGPYLSPASGGYFKYQIRLFTQKNSVRSGALSKCNVYPSHYYTSPSGIRRKNRRYFSLSLVGTKVAVSVSL